MDSDSLSLETEDAMDKSVEYTTNEFSSIRTGKAHPSIVENLTVEVASYGSSMKLKELAVITTPEPRLLQVAPFDPSTTADIEKGIRDSKLGINPSVDGKIIRLPIPELSEERRQELVKVVRGMAEDGRVRIRNARRDGIEGFRKLQKDGDITEDDLKLYEKDVQDFTDARVKQIDELLTKKEEEILTV